MKVTVDTAVEIKAVPGVVPVLTVVSFVVTETTSEGLVPAGRLVKAAALAVLSVDAVVVLVLV